MTTKHTSETWSGSLCPLDPDNWWVDDDTGERVNAITGERREYTTHERALLRDAA